MKMYFLLGALGLCLVAGIARSDDAATEQLIQQLQSLAQLQGNFQQTQYAGVAEKPSTISSGSFKLLRPVYFAWEINSPDSQLIVADGVHLWHHDRDLETVTRRSVEGREELSPLQVLAGDTAVLRERFAVTQVGNGRFQLLPLEGNPGFRELTLVFADNQISGMEIVDELNQRLFIELTDLDADSVLTPADFEFSPPEGADLFYHDQ
ncbi:MAG: outer membrane lipoprotein chaperone LolA [Halioglobus sp.]